MPKFIEHGLQTCRVRHGDDRSVVKVANGSQRHVVVGIDEAEVLDIEDRHDVATIALVHWDACEAMREDLVHGVEIEDGRVWEHEGVTYG